MSFNLKSWLPFLERLQLSGSPGPMHYRHTGALVSQVYVVSFTDFVQFHRSRLISPKGACKQANIVAEKFFPEIFPRRANEETFASARNISPAANGETFAPATMIRLLCGCFKTLSMIICSR